MAMTGGKSYLVRSKKTNYGNNNWTADLYVYVKEESQSVANNQTELLLGMYVVTPSGYDIGQWDDWNASSYLGSTSNTFNGTISKDSGKRWIVENVKMTITHKADGTGSATIYWKWAVNSPWGQYVNPSGSFTHTITTIPRATQPTVSVSSVNMGSSITISMPRASSSFTHTLTYSMENQSGTIGSGLGTSKTWTVPYSLANAIPDAKSGTCTITCKTYSGSTLIGTESVTFTAKVPEDANTRPTVSCSITPVSSLGDAFDGLFIQGLTKVKTEITATGKYKANIVDYFSTVANTGETYSPWGATYTHAAPTVSGSTRVIYSAYDSRGINNSGEQYIDVLPYSNPRVIPYTGNNSIVCERVKEFNAEKGIEETTNKIRFKVGRQYSPVISNGKRLNSCELRYRVKASTDSSYSPWYTFISKSTINTDFVDVVILDLVSSLTTSYDVQISAVDDIGTPHTVALTIPTEKVNFHEREGGDGAAFGKYSERPKALEIAEDWELVVYGDRWQSLAYSSSVSASTQEMGRAPYNDAVYYRVENGNHVYVAFNCACTYSGSQITVNSADLPADIRPTRTVYAMCATGSRSVARVMVNASGKVLIDWSQILSSADVTSSSSIDWIDGYIDYFITP